MKLFGYACTHRDPPILAGYLPLNELTILLGPNDSGKSTWLRAVERDLRGGHIPAAGDDRREWRNAGVFYARLDTGERWTLVEQALHSRSMTRVATGWDGSRPPYDDGLWHVSPQVARELDEPEDDDLPKDLAGKLRDAVKAGEKPRDRAAIVEALAESDIFAFEPAGTDGERRVWNIYWCLPPIGELAPRLAQKVRDSTLRFFADNQKRDSGGFAFGRGTYAARFGTPFHLHLADAPVAVAAVGQSQRFPIPTGLAVPAEAESIERAVTDAVTRLSEAARYGLTDITLEGPLSDEERQGRDPPSGWLDHEGNSFRVSEDVDAACAFIQEAANRLLPRFISERYRLIVETRPVDAWFDDGPLRLRIKPHGTDREPFGLDRVAEGMRLWTQLALLEAAEQTERVRGYLYELAAEWFELARDTNDAHRRGDPDADDLGQSADRARAAYGDTIQMLRELPDTRWVEGKLAQRLAARATGSVLQQEVADRRLFVVDEPERHLHPRLQREAARWLLQTAEQRSVPALLATHSTAFLSLPADGQLSYLYCSRDADDSTVRPFEVGELDDLDQVSAEMGFDRGELLATVSLFLVVEGRHDEEVLKRAFRSELADAHIAVIPMGGASEAIAVLDSQALWKYTSAKVAIATDKFTPETFEQLMGDDEQLAALRKSDAPNETKALAKLMGNARMQGKQIELLGHAEDDLLDALDEDIVIQVYPDYPGHEEARRLWAREQHDSGAKAKQKKPFYEAAFKVPNNVTTYQALGDALGAAGRKPAALAQIVDQAVKLAMPD